MVKSPSDPKEVIRDSFSNYFPIASQRYAVGDIAGNFFLDSDRYGVPKIHLCHYNQDQCTVQTLRTLPDPNTIEQSGCVTWMMVNGFGDKSFADRLVNDYRFHPLVVEDIADIDHAPKIDFFDDAIFMILRIATDDKTDAPISIIAKGDLIFTFCPCGSFKYVDQLIHRLEHRKGVIRDKGADYLLFCLLDIAVDSFFPKVETLNEKLTRMDAQVFGNKNQRILLDIKKIRKRLNIYLDSLSPLTDMIHRLTHHTACWITDDNHHFYNDAADRVRHLRKRINRLKEASSDIVILNTSITGQKMNETMRVLTAFSTIFMPLGFIAGLYGMNFDPSSSPLNMPELKWKFGYPFVICLMLSIVAGMMWFFRRRNWF